MFPKFYNNVCASAHPMFTSKDILILLVVPEEDLLEPRPNIRFSLGSFPTTERTTTDKKVKL
jgi:hypothetical protein